MHILFHSGVIAENGLGILLKHVTFTASGPPPWRVTCQGDAEHKILDLFIKLQYSP